MGKNWKSKKNQKKRKMSSTPGKSKQESCQSSPFKKSMAKNSRSYKSKDYQSWCDAMDILNRTGGARGVRKL
jgi:hypothetical protein